MKRLFAGLLAIIFCLLSCGCTDFQQALEQQLAGADRVVFVAVQTPDDFAGADIAAFDSADAPNTSCRYQIVHAKNIPEQLDMLRAAAAAPDTAVLVANLAGTGYAQAVVDIAAAHDLPLLLCGARPVQQVMDSYERCWYVGFDAALAAELQANILVEAFHGDRLNDQNGDYKQSGLILTTMAGYEHQPDSYATSIVRDMELGGIHTTTTVPPMFAANEAELYAALDALLLPQVEETAVETEVDGEPVIETVLDISPAANQTEFFVCGDTAASNAAIQAVRALQAAAADKTLAEYATPARTYALVSYGYSEAIAAGLADGTVWGAVIQDTAAATQALRALAANLALGYSPTKDTNYHLEDSKCLMLDYQVMYTNTKE